MIRREKREARISAQCDTTPIDNITIDLDLGDRQPTACVLSAGGEILAEEKIANTRERLTTPAPR